MTIEHVVEHNQEESSCVCYTHTARHLARETGWNEWEMLNFWHFSDLSDPGVELLVSAEANKLLNKRTSHLFFLPSLFL